MLAAIIGSALSGLVFFAALPSTSTYQLQSYGVGSGGVANSTTSTYALEGITGELSSGTDATSTYNELPGFIQTEQANVPKVTLSNPSNYYDKLKFVIDQQSNPTDATYALQISTTSDFSSNINYVKADHTIGATLTTGDYQTYSAWGSGSGTTIIGLASNTTYYIRAKATQGKFTESGYGPNSSAATIGQTISLCVYSNANCGAGGNAEAFGALTPGSVTNSPTNIGVDFATNADAGGKIYIYSLNGGLKSAAPSNYTITSATADLASGGVTEGFGAQVASVNQSSGGPLSKVSPYDLAANNVGIVNSTFRQILSSLNPIVGGTGTIQLQAKAGSLTPAAATYSETITIIAAAAF